jgi:hypothetical protein
MALVSKAQEMLEQATASRFIENTTYLTTVDNIDNRLNRAPFGDERLFIQEMLEGDLEELRTAYKPLKRQVGLTQRWQANINELEEGLSILRTMEESIQLRLDTNEKIQKNFN